MTKSIDNGVINTLVLKKIKEQLDRGLDRNQVIKIFFTLVIGYTGGWVFSLLKTPLPWLMGAMVITAILGMVGKNLILPTWFRRVGLVAIGVAMGQQFKPDLVSVMFRNLPIIIAASILFIALGLLNGWIIKKWFQIEWITAVFGSAPGGVSEMVLVGKEFGGNEKSIAILQSIRVFMVVMTIPFIVKILSSEMHSVLVLSSSNNVNNYTLIGLIILVIIGMVGATFGRLFHFPALYLTGPLLVTAFLTFLSVPLITMPNYVQCLAQLFIGTSIGIGFKKEDMIKLRKIAVSAVIINSMLIVICIGMALVISKISMIDLLTAMLSVAPGGIAEMSITALTVGGNVAIVTAFQICRMLIIVTIFPQVIKLNKKHQKSVEEMNL